MLLETIKNGINQKCDEIVFGRTANEYKNNFTQYQKIFYLFKNKGRSNYFMTYLFKRLKTRLEAKTSI